MNCTFTLNNYDEKQQKSSKRVRVIYNDDSEWLWSSYLNRNIAREKKYFFKSLVFTAKLRIQFRILSFNIMLFVICKRIYKKLIIITITSPEESDHVELTDADYHI